MRGFGVSDVLGCCQGIVLPDRFDDLDAERCAQSGVFGLGPMLRTNGVEPCAPSLVLRRFEIGCVFGCFQGIPGQLWRCLRARKYMPCVASEHSRRIKTIRTQPETHKIWTGVASQRFSQIQHKATLKSIQDQPKTTQKHTKTSQNQH
jgi:hypothetical protein